MNTDTDAELSELDMDFQQLELELDLGDLLSGDSNAPELMALEQELLGTEFAVADTDTDLDAGIFEATGDPVFDALLWGGIKKFLRKKAKKAIKALLKFVKKHQSCLSCIDDVQKAVSLFGRKKYPQALYAAAKAFKCIKKCLKK